MCSIMKSLFLSSSLHSVKSLLMFVLILLLTSAVNFSRLSLSLLCCSSSAVSFERYGLMC